VSPTVSPNEGGWKEVHGTLQTGFAAADAIVFDVADPGELWIDDLLLYEPSVLISASQK
jgi:hypothetical protein